MSDLDTALILIAQLRDSAPNVALMERLNLIVAKNQNKPPLGDADGSFDDKTWTMLRDFIATLELAEVKRATFIIAASNRINQSDNEPS